MFQIDVVALYYKQEIPSNAHLLLRFIFAGFCDTMI